MICRMSWDCGNEKIKGSVPVRAYIGVGSNRGDRPANCRRAVKEVACIPGCAVVECSDWFLTEPVGVKGQDWYLNGVLAVDTEISPRDLLLHLLAIEKRMGRVRKTHWESRVMDLDLLLYGEEIVHGEDLVVPHPLMHQRRFVLAPLAQIAPGLRHPCLESTIAELLERLPEEGQAIFPWRGNECCA